MRIGLDVAQHQLLWPELVERVQCAETAGFDGVWVFDHFRPLYGEPNGPCLEAWTVLPGLAPVTSRVRLGVLVTGITYRHPSILATEAITVDHISRGRLELGSGAAWHQPEHVKVGIPFPPIKERAERLEEGVQVMRLLMLPIVARQADAWHAFGSEQSMARKSRLLDQLAAKAGRDPKSILRSASLSRPWDQVRRQAAQFRRSRIRLPARGVAIGGQAPARRVVEKGMVGLAG